MHVFHHRRCQTIAFKSAGIALRQPRRQGHSAPSRRGKVKGDLQALYIRARDRGEEKQAVAGRAHLFALRFGSTFLIVENEGEKTSLTVNPGGHRASLTGVFALRELNHRPVVRRTVRRMFETIQFLKTPVPLLSAANQPDLR